MRSTILSFFAALILPAFALASSPNSESASVQPRTESGVLCYRTFTPGEFGSTNSSDMQVIPLKWTLSFTNTGANKVNHLTVVFSGVIDNIESCAPFNRAQRVPGQPLVWDLSGATIARGTSVTVHGASNVAGLSVIGWKWMYDLRQATRNKGSMTFTVDKRGVVMPTPANLVDAVFDVRGAIQTAGTDQWANGDGIVLGIPRPDSSIAYAWIRLKNPSRVRLTLEPRVGYEHSGLPRGLAATSGGGRLFGELQFLSPSRHDNKLVASLLGLKLNVIASSRGITPNGLVSLVYRDQSSPYCGWQVSRIIRTADTMLTYFKGHTTREYLALETALERINHAFCGPIDTISATNGLVFTGVPNPEASNFLGTSLDGTPVTHHDAPATETVTTQTPVAFGLGQNYPNPFNPSTVIPFTIAEPSAVHLTVYNLIGQEVEVLVNGGMYEAGEHQVSFQAHGLASGTYLYRLTVEPVAGARQPFTSIKKMSIIQ